jgi:hypothetical protein
MSSSSNQGSYQHTKDKDRIESHTTLIPPPQTYEPEVGPHPGTANTPPFSLHKENTGTVDDLLEELQSIQQEYNKKLSEFQASNKKTFAAIRAKYEKSKTLAKEKYGRKVFDAVRDLAPRASTDPNFTESSSLPHGDTPYEQTEVEAKLTTLAREINSQLEEVRKSAAALYPSQENADLEEAERTKRRQKNKAAVSQQISRKKALIGLKAERSAEDIPHDQLQSALDLFRSQRTEKENQNKAEELQEMHSIEMRFIPEVLETFQKQLQLREAMDVAGLPMCMLTEDEEKEIVDRFRGKKK